MSDCLDHTPKLRKTVATKDRYLELKEWFIGFYVDNKFVAGAFVDALGILDAYKECKKHNITIVGQIDCKPCITFTCPNEHKNKLLTAEEISIIQRIKPKGKYVPIRKKTKDD